MNLTFNSHLAKVTASEELVEQLKVLLTFDINQDLKDKLDKGDFDFPYTIKSPSTITIGRPIIDISMGGKTDYSGYLFPTGFIRYLWDSLPREITRLTSNYSYSPKPFVGLRDYQSEALKASLKYYRGIIKIPTGGGKSYIEGELCNQLYGARILVTVPTRRLLYEIQSKLMDMTSEPIGLIGDGYFDTSHRITVAIPKSLISRQKSLSNWLGGIDVWLADEVHKLSNKTGWITSRLLHYCRYRIGFSATPCINPMLYGMFGPILYEVKETVLCGYGAINEPLIKVYEAPPSPHYHPKANKICRNMREYRFLYQRVILDNVARNKLIAQIAEDYLSDKSKDPLVIIVNRVHKKPNHPSRLIPLLSHLGDIPIIKGNLSSKEVNSILDRLANREIRLAIAGPSIIKEGVDIPYIGGIIIAGAGKGGTKDDTSNYRHGFIQQVGRALRIGSHKPEIFLLRDSQFMFKKQSEELIVSAINAYGKDSLIYSNG